MSGQFNWKIDVHQMIWKIIELSIIEVYHPQIGLFAIQYHPNHPIVGSTKTKSSKVTILMILASTVEQTSDGLSLQADRSDGVWILWMLGISQ